MRWCAKNSRMIIYLGGIISTTILYQLVSDLDLPIWFYIFFALCMAFILYCFMNYFKTSLLSKAARSLNEQCDPYPFLNETEDQLSYNHSKIYETVLLIDKCAALANLGEYQKVREILESINIDKYAGTLSLTKFCYYNNLADVYIHFGEIEKAEVWHNKSKQIFDDIKPEKSKSIYLSVLQNNAAEIAYEKKDYDKAQELINSSVVTNFRDSVYKALMIAKIYLAKGEKELAKRKLQYVVENGNKLYCVQIAKKMLDDNFFD